MSIDLSLNETQLMLQQTAKSFCESRCTLADVRAWEESEAGFSQDIWREMAGLGWTGITLPERYGGLGGGLLDLYPVCVELGRSLLSSPLLESSVVAAHTILEACSDAQKDAHLAGIVSGESIVIPAVLEADAAFGPDGVNMLATQSGEGFKLEGQKLLVPFAAAATAFLVPARLNGEIVVFLVPADAAGISIERLPNTPGLPLFAVTFSECTLPADAKLGAQAWDALERAMLKAGVAQIACVIGTGERVQEMTANYARDRVQFGGPIGRYQAVQYMVSDILIEVQRARLFTLNAAWRVDAGQPWEREAARAKAHGSRAAAHIMRQAHEVHAGVAFIVDHDLQLFSRRAKFWEFNFGDAAYHDERMLLAAGL